MESETDKDSEILGYGGPKVDTLTLRIPSVTGKRERLIVSMDHCVIKTNIENYVLPTLADTGCSLSALAESLFNALKRKGHKMHEESTHVQVFMADGSHHIIKKRIFTEFIIQGRKFKQNFLIAPKLDRPMILGVDFFRKYKAKFKFANELPQNFMIRSIKRMVIPPRHEYETSVPIDWYEDLSQGMGVLENVCGVRPKSYFVKRYLVKPDGEDNRVRICLFNASDFTIDIKKGQPIGIYSVRRPEDFIQGDEEWGKVELGGEKEIKVKDSSKFVIGSNLKNDQKTGMMNLLKGYDHVFYKKGTPLSATPLYEHRIDLKKGAEPRAFKAYRMNPHMQGHMVKILKEQVQQDIIEPCVHEVEHASPAFLVEKPRDPETGELQYRMVIDYRHQNKNIKTQIRSFISAGEALDAAGAGENPYYSKLDAVSGFSQVKIRPQDRRITAFSTPVGTFQMKRLPMGLKTSPKAFAVVIQNLVKHMPNIVPYMDDICVKSPTFDKHLEDLKELFEVFIAANLKFKKEKCAFGFDEIPFLGFLVSKKGIRPDPEKVEPIAAYPVPTTIKEMRSFAGMANYYRNLIKGYAEIMQPLYDLTKKTKRFIWTKKCNEAFIKIKKAICSDVVIQSPNYKKEFILATDASDIALGACLSQKDKYGNLRPVAFAGRNLIPAEKNYSVTMKELQGVKFGLVKFKHYLMGTAFTIMTDHSALLAINEKQDLHHKMQRMLDYFNQFDYNI